MGVYLIVMFTWQVVHQGPHIASLAPFPMPDMETCETVGRAMEDMSGTIDWRCIPIEKKLSQK